MRRCSQFLHDDCGCAVIINPARLAEIEAAYPIGDGRVGLTAVIHELIAEIRRLVIERGNYCARAILAEAELKKSAKLLAQLNENLAQLAKELERWTKRG